MKRMLLALGLSALTLVGGHFYNRRWDRAVPFLVALVFWGLGMEPGKKAAIKGYLMAKRGRCDEANELFEKARSEGGSNCIPKYYRAGCE